MTASSGHPRRPPPSAYTSLSEVNFPSVFPASLTSNLPGVDDDDEQSNVYTVDSAIDTIGLGLFQYFVLLLAGLCWTAESMELLLLSFIKQPLQCEWGISDSKVAFITTCVGLGMLAGSTVWGLFADRYGRRFSFIASTAFTSGMGLFSAMSFNYNMLLFSRGLVGFGIGGVPVSFSLLMEFLPSAQRGSWGMSLALFWAIGAIFEAVVAMFVLPSLGWRWLIAVSTFPLFLVLFLSFWLSESPRWLASRGNLESADNTLLRMARFNNSDMPRGRLAPDKSDDNDPTQSIQQEIDAAFTSTDALVSNSHNNHATFDEDYIAPEQAEAVPSTGAQSTNADSTFSSLFRRGARMLFVKVAVIWFSCSFVYYGLIMLQPEIISAENEGRRCNYAVNECAALSQSEACAQQPICSWIPKDKSCIPTGLTHGHEQTPSALQNDACARKLTTDDFISTLWASVGEMPGVVAAFIVVDVIGRRPLLGYMFGTLCIAFLLLLNCLSRVGETAVFFVSRGASSGSFQALYLLTNEVYPSTIRATAMGLSSSIARVGLLLTPFIAQFLINLDYKLALGVYFLVSLLAIAAIVGLPIETTGRSLFTSMEDLVQSLREARLRRNDVGPSFANDPEVHPLIRFFRWSAPLDGISVK